MKKIGDTVLPQGAVVDEFDYIDLKKWSGRPLQNIPVHVRERDEAKLHVSSLSYLIDDPTCNPRSGGIAGYENIAPYYGVTPDHFRRKIAKERGYINWLGESKGKGAIPVTHVSSATIDRANFQLKREHRWRKNLGI